MLKNLENPVVKKSLEFAKLSLVGKKRYSGEDFSDHTLKVAQILKSYQINDQNILAAAILHHSFSDGAATLDDIKKEFGEDISEMVKNVDSLRVIKLPNISNQQFQEALRKMFLVLAKDLRVVLIKLADILDNLKTLEYLPEEKRIEVAKETIEIFAPLTERLGIGEMKGVMQDLAFPYLYPKEYIRVKKLLKINIDNLEKRLLKVKVNLKKELDNEGINYFIESRTKHLYSLFLKLKRPEINFDISKVYDLIAFRIIVDSVEDCYKVLGSVHKVYRPLPGGVSDFIAYPKLNGYKSIHTKVFGPEGKPFEIQIRTKEMHEEAEFGIAAHWHYSETKSKGVSDQSLQKGVLTPNTKLDWIKKLSSWQEEIVDNEDFLASIRTDFFGERIFVFTPKGDVKDLPLGSTPIDFGFAVHTDLGRLITGAKVNGKLVSLNYLLKNSDICELVLSKEKSKLPNRDWLNFTKTSTARRKIKRALGITKVN